MIILFFSVKSSIMSAQYRFFKGRPTNVINLIELTSCVLNCFENGVQVNAIYTDFSGLWQQHSCLSRVFFDQSRAICESLWL
jgi:hypothetical protein